MSINKWHTEKSIKENYAEKWNPLFDIALKYSSSKLYDPECTHYLIHYWNIFSNLLNEDLKLLEIGVKNGDSLKMWSDLLSENSQFYGIDINPEPLKDFKLKNTELFFGDQADIPFLFESLKSMENKLDFIIDDGSHKQDQIISSFNFLFQYGLKPGGI